MSMNFIFRGFYRCVKHRRITHKLNIKLFRLHKTEIHSLIITIKYSFITRHRVYVTVILSLPLIQEGQLSVSDERMCTILVNRLED